MRNLWLGCLVYLIYVPGRTRYRYTHLYIHMYAYKTSFVYNQCAHIYIYILLYTHYIYIHVRDYFILLATKFDHAYQDHFATNIPPNHQIRFG